MQSSVVAILLVGLCAGAARADQAPASPARQARQTSPWERLEAWLAAAARHEPGTLDAVAIEIASRPDDHLTTVVDDVGELARFLVRAHVRLERSGQLSAPAHHRGRTLSLTEIQRLFGLTDDEAARGDVSRLAMRGAMLHTDITVRLDEYDRIVQSRTPVPARTAVLVYDGRQEGIADRGPHWEIARSLLDVIPEDSPHAERKRRWYVAAAAFMHSRGRLADLDPHLVRAARLFPEDAEILFYTGAMHETLASPSIQEAIRGIAPRVNGRVAVRDARTSLEQARTFFRRALESDPDHVDARVRLGHALGALGRNEEAAKELQCALGAPASDLLHYYAALFLGDIRSRLGQPDAARTAFEQALALYPRAQAPRLGLSSLARAAGDRSAATAALLEGLPAHHDDDFRDPWWSYFFTGIDHADRALDEWRRSVGPWSNR